MRPNTERLIQELVHGLQPVRPLSRPHVRTAIWFLLSAPYIAVLLLITPWHTLPSARPDTLFLIEELAALALGLGSATAAFASVVPGHSRRFLKWLFVPLAFWFVSVGLGCLRNFREIGSLAISSPHNPFCLPFIIVLGAFPGIVLVVMLRRGAALTPHLTTGLAALAAAALSNFFSRLFHTEPFTLMLLVWHVGGVLLLSGLAATGGRWLLRWRSAPDV
jgi:hypothetical protein